MITGKQLKGTGTKITLDRERIINFDLNAYCELEDIYENISDAFEAMEKGSMKAIRALLYAGLKEDDETLTLKEVGRLISSIKDLTSVSEKIMEAFEASTPEKEDIKTKN